MNVGKEMHTIEVFGYGEREICAGCEGECGNGCSPGAKVQTIALVDEFSILLKNEKLPVTCVFYEATDENLARHTDVQRLLSMADLSPAIVLDGKLLFFGGFSPEGLLEEVKKRVAV